MGVKNRQFFLKNKKNEGFFFKGNTFILTLYILYIYFRGLKKPVISRGCEEINEKKTRVT